MISSRDKIKEWFKTGAKPTQDQFYDWIDSYWHKYDDVSGIINQIEGATYMGEAYPGDVPPVTEQKIFYTASTAGKYTNFAGVTLEKGETAVLLYDKAWSKVTLVVVAQELGDDASKAVSQKVVSEEIEQINNNSIGIKNLLNYNDSDFIEGKYFSHTTMVDNENFAISGYIELSKKVGSLTLSVNGKENINSGFVVYYDKNKQPIKDNTLSTTTIVTWFEGVAYVRYSIINYSNGQHQVNIGTEIQTYTPYNEILLKDDVRIQSDNIKDRLIKSNHLLNGAANTRVIENNSITPSKVTFMRQNLFNINDPDFLPNKYFSTGNGTIADATNYGISGYIPFDSGKLVCSHDGKLMSTGGYNIYYNANKEIIGYSLNIDINSVVTWFEGVAYVRFSIVRIDLGKIQIEYGDTPTDYIEYKEEAIIDDKYLNGKLIKDSNVDVDNLSENFTAKYSINLLDHSKMQYNKYAVVRQDNGLLVFYTAENLSVSDYIKVKPQTQYSISYGHSYCPLDQNKNPLVTAAITVGGEKTFTTPENCEYVVINFYNKVDSAFPYNDALKTARVYEGDILYPFIPYGITMGENFKVKDQQKTSSTLGSDGVNITAESLNEGENISLGKSGFPIAIQQNQITFSAKISNWGNGIRIGRGYNVYSSCYFTITSTTISLYRWESSAYITLYEEVEHNLVLEDYINIIISERGDKALFIVQTLKGIFTHEFKYRDFNGSPTVISLGAELTDCKLNVTNKSIKSPVWMFGDSYYGTASPLRQLYYLKNWNMLNCLVQGFGGQGFTSAYQDLQRCLQYGMPKYIVWSLGMNDNNNAVVEDITTTDWYKTFEKIKGFCEINNIVFIATTIPEVRSASYKNKDNMSKVIRDSGARYIDVAKAVGSNSQGQWYGNGTDYDYQSTDDVHPSQYGASAIATQFLIDFPEIMEY